MRVFSPGKVLLTLTSFWSAYGSFRFDWNETHIYNPEWPPHAKFHNAQTMSTGVVAGAAAIYTLWRAPLTESRLRAATATASLYWVTQLSAALYPGTALLDRPKPAAGAGPAEQEAKPPRWRGPQTVVASVSLALNALSYLLERRRLTAGRKDLRR